MAVFIAKRYTRSGKEAKQKIRYIQNRKGKDGEKVSRTLLGYGGTVKRAEAYELIDEAPKGSYFYHLIINPDPEKEDTYKDIYIPRVTQETMNGLAEQLGYQFDYVSAIHADHSDKRHVHIVAILPRRLNRDDLALGRDVATEAALGERRERDHIREAQKQRQKGKQWERER